MTVTDGRRWSLNTELLVVVGNTHSLFTPKRPRGRKRKYILEMKAGKSYHDRKRKTEDRSSLARAKSMILDQQRGAAAKNKEGRHVQSKNLRKPLKVRAEKYIFYDLEHFDFTDIHNTLNT